MSAVSTAAVPAATCPKAIHRLLYKAFKVAYTWQQGNAKARARIVPRLLKAKRLASGLVASQITSIVTYLNTGGQDPTEVVEAIATTGETARLGNC